MALAALPAIGREFHVSPAHTQYMLVVFFLGMGVSQIVYGPLADRFGRKPPLYAGLIVFVLANLGAAFAPNFEFLLVMRFFQAVGGCAGLVVSRAIVRDLFEGQESAKSYALMMTAFMAVSMFAPLGGSFLLDAAGWSSIFLFVGLFAFLTLVFSYGLLPETLSASNRLSLTPAGIFFGYVDLLRDRSFQAYLISGGFTSGTLMTYLAASPHVFIDVLDMSPRMYGVFFVVTSCGTMAATLFFNRLCKTYKVAAILDKAYVVNAAANAAFLLACLTGDERAVFVTAFFAISSFGAVTPANLALAMSSQAHRAGSASALYGTTQFVFAFVISSAVGFITYDSPIPLGVTMMLGGLLGFATNRLLTNPREGQG